MEPSDLIQHMQRSGLPVSCIEAVHSVPLRQYINTEFGMVSEQMLLAVVVNGETRYYYKKPLQNEYRRMRQKTYQRRLENEI